VTDARETAAFAHQVEQWIVKAVARRADNFDELIQEMPGVYPPLIADALDRLLGAGAIAPSTYRTAISRATNRRQPPTAWGTLLPPPHPLDFDWRYAPAAIENLLARALAATKPGETVVLLGTPTLYVAASQLQLDRRFVLIDYSSAILERLAAVGTRGTLHLRDLILDGIPDVSAAAVIADPPWYPEHIEAFLWAAASCGRVDAPLFISLPGPGTRPGSPRERNQFWKRAMAHGFRRIGSIRASIPYLTPPFEVNALAAAGWHNLPTDWRRGDLEILASSGRPPDRLEWTGALTRWEERNLGWVRVRIARRESSVVDPVLRHLVVGDVLADVSRRHPVREQVDVWTSGNRVYGCTSPNVLLAILDAMMLGVDPARHIAATVGRALDRAEAARVVRSASQLRWIARVEARELVKLGWKAPPPWTERMAS
jgi:hypothetical protein